MVEKMVPASIIKQTEILELPANQKINTHSVDLWKNLEQKHKPSRQKHEQTAAKKQQQSENKNEQSKND